MSKNARHIIFSLILIYFTWLWIKISYGDEEDTEYSESDIRVFSVPLSSTRNRQKERCRIPNADDPKGEILKGVYCPMRLKIMDKDNPVRKCVGVLIGKHRAVDGDLTFDIVPNQECRYLVNEINVKYRHGGLHCEIVPTDKDRLEGKFDRMRLKSVVEVVGVWVEDTNHRNWRELHPVTSLKLIRKRD
jgi:hypothetical protein